MKPVLVVVQCRCESRRLPAKALYPLAGVPMVGFLLRRLRCALDERRFRIVLATTRRPADDAVAAWGEHERVEVLRGEESDVLARFARCLKRFPSPWVVRVTADNPLTCPQALRSAVSAARRSGADYVECRGLPRGAAADVFGTRALERLVEETRHADEREHINLYILRHPERFKTLVLNFRDDRCRPEMSLTVDTMEDWRRVSAAMGEAGAEPWRTSLREAVARMDRCSVRRTAAA